MILDISIEYTLHIIECNVKGDTPNLRFSNVYIFTTYINFLFPILAYSKRCTAFDS